MQTATGSRGNLTDVHAAVSIAQQYAQSDLPADAKWVGNTHVNDIGDVLVNPLNLVGVPKGSDNLTDAQFDEFRARTGVSGQGNLLDAKDLPTSEELINQGRVGVYELPATRPAFL